MGKIKQGILGGFNGTTGSVVGASWKGIAYMRGKAQSIKNPRTSAQQENRTAFGACSSFASRNLALVNIGLSGVSVKQSAYNSFVRLNMDKMAFYVDDEQEDNPVVINPEDFVISRGAGYGDTYGAPTISSGAVKVTATTVHTSSMFHLLVVNARTLEARDVTISGSSSAPSEISLTYPESWKGDNVYAFCFMLYDDATNGELRVTNSQYAGSVAIPAE